jgi:SNW domain-containing protein 1
LGFVPRKPEDFAGGGAFPEIHVAQYPLDMGRPDAIRSARTLAVSINGEGQVNYNALVQQGSNKGKIVHSEHTAIVPKVDRLTNEVGAAL